MTQPTQHAAALRIVKALQRQFNTAAAHGLAVMPVNNSTVHIIEEDTGDPIATAYLDPEDLTWKVSVKRP